MFHSILRNSPYLFSFSRVSNTNLHLLDFKLMNSVEETIYNLLNPSSSNFKPSYRSIFASNISDKKNNSYRTMGPAMVSKPDPSHPLRRREKSLELPPVTPFIRVHRMPPIPKVTNRNKNPAKNFIEENIHQIINSLPTCPRRYVVADRKGNKFLIDGSGLQKDFIHKKNYGQIPLYLQARKTLVEPVKSQVEEHLPVLLPAEERLCLIHNLKDRYKETFAEYQRLPLRIETTSHILKETYLTRQLIDLEHDIHFLEKHSQIYLANPCVQKSN